MKVYFEFVKQGYYALVTVTVNKNEPIMNKGLKATEVYLEYVAGDNIDEILSEGLPQMVSKEYAFWKLANCYDSKDYSVKELLKEFEEMENTCVVIDGALV